MDSLDFATHDLITSALSALLAKGDVDTEGGESSEHQHDRKHHQQQRNKGNATAGGQGELDHRGNGYHVENGHHAPGNSVHSSEAGPSMEDLTYLKLRCQLIPLEAGNLASTQGLTNGTLPKEGLFSYFVTRNGVNNLIAFADFAASPLVRRDIKKISKTIPKLIEILEALLMSIYERNIFWADYSYPDRLAFSTVAALLTTAQDHPDERANILGPIGTFIEDAAALTARLESSDIVTMAIPLLLGALRAITATPFHWSTESLGLLTNILSESVLSPKFGTEINGAIDAIFSAPPTADYDGGITYAKKLIQKYAASHAVISPRPFSGNLLVREGLRALRTAYLQVVAESAEDLKAADQREYLYMEGALGLTAADQSREKATRRQAHVPLHTISDALRKQVQSAENQALQYLDEAAALLSQARDTEFGLPPLASYAADILAEAILLSAACDLILDHPEPVLVKQLKLLLSDRSPFFWMQTHGAAIDAAAMLAINFPPLCSDMIQLLKRFITTPCTLFEVEEKVNPLSGIEGFASYEVQKPWSAHRGLLHHLVVRLGSALLQNESSDLVMSTAYSLVNVINSTASITSMASNHDDSSTPAMDQETDRSSIRMARRGSMAASIGAYKPEAKAMVLNNVVSALAGLATFFQRTEITLLASSTLIQRLRQADIDITAETTVLTSMVDVAMIASEPTFLDIVQQLSALSRQTMSQSYAILQNAVVAAQNSLAHRIRARHELQMPYLIELLTLFSDKGLLIPIGNKAEGRTARIAELGALIPVLDALLSHKALDVRNPSNSEIVSLFRNFWFTAVAYGFCSNPLESTVTRDWIKSLSHIAAKSPGIVEEKSISFLETEVEYNPVLRRQWTSVENNGIRNELTENVPRLSGMIKGLSFPLLLFLCTAYHLEKLRAYGGIPSVILTCFMNANISSHPQVGPALEQVALRIMDEFAARLSRQAIEHNMDPQEQDEIRGLLLETCSRYEKVHQLAMRACDKLFLSFPSLLCDNDTLFTYFELLNMLWQSCAGEYEDEYSPVYTFKSSLVKCSIDLSDSYAYRNQILTELRTRGRKWLETACSRAPFEMQGILQKYISKNEDTNEVKMGLSIAVDTARSISPSDRFGDSVPIFGEWKPDRTSTAVTQYSARAFFAGEANGAQFGHHLEAPDITHLLKGPGRGITPNETIHLKRQMRALEERIAHKKPHSPSEMSRVLHRLAAAVLAGKNIDYDLLSYVIWIPFKMFTGPMISLGTQVWLWMINERPELETKIMVEITGGWGWSIRKRKGVFSDHLNQSHPLTEEHTFAPSDRKERVAQLHAAEHLLQPHTILLNMISSRYQAMRYRSGRIVDAITRIMQLSAMAHRDMCTHPLARELRFNLIMFGFYVMSGRTLESSMEYILRGHLYSAAFSWFALVPKWSFGNSRLQLQSDARLLKELTELLLKDTVRDSALLSQRKGADAALIDHAKRSHKPREQLLSLLLESELNRITVWMNPLGDPKRAKDHVPELEKAMTDAKWKTMVTVAWEESPDLATTLPLRFKNPVIQTQVKKLVREQPWKALDNMDALHYILGDAKLDPTVKPLLKWLFYWAPVPPITAIVYFQPGYQNEPHVLQYAMRTLRHWPVELTFFYVPQLVQALRGDALGYVERFILEAAKVSQLFAHQIIWNMQANSYADEDGEEPNDIKPTLDRVKENIIEGLTGDDKNFYEREFKFFEEVTSISGKLKPFIKKSKPEKKAKIDEEIAQIKVDEGVYLPSNPDGVVVDIDYKSGKPLQSHAKAPFMATFKIRKQIKTPNLEDEEEQIEDEGAGQHDRGPREFERWQAAIFKVGDDVRQDVLVLQLIAQFKNIWSSIGLDHYVFPYRVTATGPGCGVIDVIPAATSRDMMGREQVNSMLEWFVNRFGGEHSISFQQARATFIHSMAAYSVVSYLLLLKDRHNGNLMINDLGAILHIDFGFCFEIAPGGGYFEPKPFKLTHEMVEVMGGVKSPGFRKFCQILVQCFLASRPYVDQIIHTVKLMLDSGLPCFKGELTLKHLRDRFVPDVSEREAAKHAMKLISSSIFDSRAQVYDLFQEMTNGIPWQK